MADSREVLVWGESTFYLWNGASSAMMAYAESVEVTETKTYRKFLFPTTGVGYAARSQYVETDNNVAMHVGQMFMGPSTYQLVHSAVNASATLNFVCSADNATGTFTLWSARCENFQLVGSDKNIWRCTTNWIGPELSGV